MAECTCSPGDNNSDINVLSPCPIHTLQEYPPVPTQSFNDSFLANTKVPGGPTGSDSAAPTPPKAVGSPAGVQRHSGTESPRVTTQTKRAESRSTPSERPIHTPSEVDKYNDDEV